MTHRRDLASAGSSIELFLASGVLELGDKLGPILWQFAPFSGFDATAFGDFLALLPQEVGGHALRHVVEVRHSSFVVPAFAELLQRYKVAVALVDDAQYPAFEDVTGGFVYARLRRSSRDEPAGYSPQALDGWASRARDGRATGLSALFISSMVPNSRRRRGPRCSRDWGLKQADQHLNPPLSQNWQRAHKRGRQQDTYLILNRTCL